jgi:hypothetical protein
MAKTDRVIQVVLRLDRKTIDKLNSLVGDRQRACGKLIGRNVVVSELVERAHAELDLAKKKTG